MKDLGITKGEWKVFHERERKSYFVSNHESIIVSESDYNIDYMTTFQDCSKANAKLIADAGNTAQQCGLPPSELLKQRDELLSALKLITRRLEKELNYPDYNSFIDKAKKAIENTTKQ